MKMHLRLFVVFFFSQVLQSDVKAQLLDAFTTGSSTSTTSTQATQTGTTNYRYIFFHPASGAPGRSIITTGNGKFVAQIPTGRHQRFDLTYGVDEQGNNRPLNLRLQTRRYLNIEFDCNFVALTINVVAQSDVGARSQYSGTFAVTPTPKTMRIPLSSFGAVNGFTWADVDFITFAFQGTGVTNEPDYIIKKIWFD